MGKNIVKIGFNAQNNRIKRLPKASSPSFDSIKSAVLGRKEKKSKEFYKKKSTSFYYDSGNSSLSPTQEKKMPKELSKPHLTINANFRNSGNSSSPDEDELKRLEQELKEKRELIKRKQEEEKKKLKKERKQKFDPYKKEITFEEQNIQFSPFEEFNLKICPLCSSKIKKFPTKQQRDVLRQFFKCKKCSFTKELIFKI